MKSFLKKGSLLPIILSILLLFSACRNTGIQNTKSDVTSENAENNTDTVNNNNNNNNDVKADFSKSDADMFTDRDLRVSYDEDKSVMLRLNGDSISCSSDTVRISGATATITGEGTYILSGTLDDGMIVVNAKDTDKLQLVFNGVSINSKTSAPIYILEADKVFVTLTQGTSNTLSNGGTFTAIDKNNIDAVVFSKQDLTFNGSGSLTVNSPAGHGIVSKDDLVLTGGTFTVNSASHGLDANDSVRITNSSLTVSSGKDGIHAENTDNAGLGFVYISGGDFDISAEGDGISAGAYMQIEGGNFNIVSGGGSVNAKKQISDSWGSFKKGERAPSQGFSQGGTDNTNGAADNNAGNAAGNNGSSIKAIKASGDLLIRDGSFVIDSADDSIHSNGSVTINGGTFQIASGDDGFHADEALNVTAGNINITTSYEGLEALNINISGGDIRLVASDDGINAAGGTDSSGFGGFRGNDRFGGGPGGHGGDPGGGFGGGSGNGTIIISGGNIYVNASGDGIDANGTLEISGGHITVVGPVQGDTSTLDYDVSGVITGGTFIGTGASGMAQTFSSSEQGVIAVKAGRQTAGTQITLTDASGNILISHAPELPFEVIILSSPELVKGKTYTLTVGSSSNTVTAG